MKRKYLLYFTLILVSVGCQTTRVTQDKLLVFKNVHVVTMESDNILKNQNVIIKNGVILEIGPQVKIPDSAEIIDGQNHYLMPALADMHVHLQNEQDLIVLASQGISVVRNMHTDSNLALKFKKQVNKNPDLFMPDIYAAGALFDGAYKSHTNSITENPKIDFFKEIKSQKDQGYDFIKIYDALSLDAFNKIIEASKSLDIPVVGHVPYRVGLEKALKSRIYSIEHLSGFSEAIELPNSPYKRNYSVAWATNQAYWNDGWLGGTGVRFAYTDSSSYKKIAQSVRESGTWICPTLIQRDTFLWGARDQLFTDQSLWKYFPPAMTKGWQSIVKMSPYKVPPLKDLEKSWRQRRLFVKALHDAGVPLLLGTDLGNIGILAGFSVYQELQHFVESGLSPYQALKTGTKNPATFLKINSGTVSPGKRADLLLVEKNPLLDIKNLNFRRGLVLRGIWYDQTDLNKRLEDLAEAYKSGKLKPETYYGK